MSVKKITRLMLHEKFMEYPQESVQARKNRVLDFLKEEFLTNGNESATTALEVYTTKSFFAPYFRNWKICSRNNQRFLTKYHLWLAKEVHFPSLVINCLPGPSGVASTSSGIRGRPTKTFEKSSDVIKRRRTEELRKTTSSKQLAYATAMKLRHEGDDAAAKLLTESTTTTPTSSKRILSKWRTPEGEQKSFSPEEALALIISLNLTKRQYLVLRHSAKTYGHNLYPVYDQVVEAKKKMYPDGIIVTETKCEVPLQNLLNVTCESILKTLSPQFTEQIDHHHLTLYCKWGFDGSSGYSTYKQKFETERSVDGSIFVTSLVPLRLVETGTENVIWKNPRPSSTRFCRPIKLEWIHETDEISRAEEIYITQQISTLQPYISKIGPIHFVLMLTMVDGKVCNALAGASGMRCYICQATISQLNEIKSLRERSVQPEMYRFGLSVLHAYIRFFECLLHISYRLEIKSWKVGKEKKQMLEARKKFVQGQFRQKMGLIVDVPKPGYGTTNDGNTARRFFANPKLSAEVTGIDENLIRNFSVVLKTINSGREINTDQFEMYCLKTAERFISLYGWFYMPTSVHKILIHGAHVIKEAILPIGELSEEAQEAKNKDIRRYREHHTRKISHVTTNKDLIQRLILSSDPYLSSVSEIKYKKKTMPDPEVEALLLSQTLETLEETEDEEMGDDDDDSDEIFSHE